MRELTALCVNYLIRSNCMLSTHMNNEKINLNWKKVKFENLFYFYPNTFKFEAFVLKMVRLTNVTVSLTLRQAVKSHAVKGS